MSAAWGVIGKNSVGHGDKTERIRRKTRRGQSLRIRKAKRVEKVKQKNKMGKKRG